MNHYFKNDEYWKKHINQKLENDIKKENVKIGDSVTLFGTGNISYSKNEQTAMLREIQVTTQVEEKEIPVSWLDDGIFKYYYDSAFHMLNSMSLKEKIGQLFLVRVPLENQVNVMKKHQFGGYILFGRDTKNKSKEDLVADIKSYQEVSKIPPLIAVDEEGGTVTRISHNKQLAEHMFLSPQEVFLNGGFDAIKRDTIDKSALLSFYGINLNLAPVAGVSTNKNDYMFDRTFGKDALKTSEFIKTVIKASKKTGISYTLKHFPGYGKCKYAYWNIY